MQLCQLEPWQCFEHCTRALMQLHPPDVHRSLHLQTICWGGAVETSCAAAANEIDHPDVSAGIRDQY